MGIIHPSILFGVPLVLLSFLLQVLPATSNWLPYLPHLSSLVLLVLSLMAMHHLSRGKALAVLLIPPGIVLMLTFVGAIVLTAPVSHERNHNDEINQRVS